MGRFTFLRNGYVCIPKNLCSGTVTWEQSDVFRSCFNNKTGQNGAQLRAHYSPQLRHDPSISSIQGSVNDGFPVCCGNSRYSQPFFFFFFFFCLFRAAPMAYGGSQARGLIGAVATSLRHSHSHMGYDLHHSYAGSLTHWARPGIEPTTSWFLVGFVSAAPWWELLPAHFELGSISANTFRGSFPWPQVISSICMHWSIPENSRERLPRFLAFSFWVALFSLVLCVANSSHVGFTGLSALSHQIKDLTRLFLCPPWLCWGLEVLSRQ